jgi:hypothetical protein
MVSVFDEIEEGCRIQEFRNAHDLLLIFSVVYSK